MNNYPCKHCKNFFFAKKPGTLCPDCWSDLWTFLGTVALIGCIGAFIWLLIYITNY